MCWAGLKPEAEPGPARPMLWALCGLGLGSRFLRPEARAQAWAFNPFILHMYPPVVRHDPTGWPPDAWELKSVFFCRLCLVTGSHTARPYGPTRHAHTTLALRLVYISDLTVLPLQRTGPYDCAT